MPINNKGVLFCFTDFDETNINNGYQSVYNLNSDVVRGIAWGVETCPQTGKKHNQGFIQVYKQCRWTWLQKNFFKNKLHMEVCRGSIYDNETYCSKQGNYHKLGMFVSRGYRSDLVNIKEDLKAGATMYDIMENYTGDFLRYHAGIEKMKTLIDERHSHEFRAIHCTTLTGPAGSGKTSYVMKKHGSKNVFKLDSGADSKFLFNGYQGQDVLLIDDYAGWIKYTYLLHILDGYHLPLNVKNGRTFAKWTKVYITSNVKPGNWYVKIGDNLKRRVAKCLEVTKGNTRILSHPWQRTYTAEYS